MGTTVQLVTTVLQALVIQSHVRGERSYQTQADQQNQNVLTVHQENIVKQKDWQMSQVIRYILLKLLLNTYQSINQSKLDITGFLFVSLAEAFIKILYFF
jgi:hypothetical protein